MPVSGLLIGVLVLLAAIIFAWGWVRAARFRSERGRAPWGISPVAWGAIHVVLLPIAWILYFSASRTTALPDATLAHRYDTVIADTAEEREKLTKIARELPLLRPPEPDSRGWHPDPLGQRDYRFFDGRRWTREVTDDPKLRVTAAIGDAEADLGRRLRTATPPADKTPSWHLDPLGEHHFRYFDGEAWTVEVREARSS